MLHHTTPKHLFARLPILLPAALVLVLPLGSCSVTSGAAIGGLIGAGLGQAAGGDTESTLMGAALGAGIGAAIGYNVEKKREARLLASRRATEEELEAAKREAAAISASARKRSIERAEAYAEEHADEHRAAAVDAKPMTSEPMAEERSQAVVPSRETSPAGSSAGSPAEPASEPSSEPQDTRLADTAPAEEPIIEEYEPAELEPEQTFQAANIPDDTIISIVPLPNSDGVVFTDARTGELIDAQVHQLEDIKDVSDDSTSDVEEDDEAKPFTLILSDKKSGKTRQYTAIYSA